jgi:hypothetical protein
MPPPFCHFLNLSSPKLSSDLETQDNRKGNK